jgi:putative oxidoreductase
MPFNALLSSNPLNVDVGLLVLRLGVGLSMAIFHGWGKITGGAEAWARIGGAMPSFGVDGIAVVWGFLAAFAEFGGSLLLVLGILFRPAAAMLAFTMLIAVNVHLGMPAENPNAGWNGASHALELFCVYLTLLLTGPGKLALRPPR